MMGMGIRTIIAIMTTWMMQTETMVSMMMAMADALAHHEMVAFKDSCDEAGVLPSPLCMKRARSCLDFFGTSGRAPVTMKKYETILNKIEHKFWRPAGQCVIHALCHSDS